MLNYAPRPKHQASPGAVAAVVALHAAAFAAVLLVKPDLVPFVDDKPIGTFDIPLPDPPPPPPAPPEPAQTPPTQPRVEWTNPKPEVSIAPPTAVTSTTFEAPDIPLVNIADIPLGPQTPTVEVPAPSPPAPIPALVAARLLTSGADLRPPYPASLQRQEKEAALRLRLQIDARGRVTDVTLLNQADRRFFDAAEKHLKRVWRYSPATRGGNPIASDLTVTLRFELTD